MFSFLIRIVDSRTVFHVGTGFHCTTHNSDCGHLPGVQIIQAAMEKDMYNKVSPVLLNA